jgi:hypothetical protein
MKHAQLLHHIAVDDSRLKLIQILLTICWYSGSCKSSKSTSVASIYILGASGIDAGFFFTLKEIKIAQN